MIQQHCLQSFPPVSRIFIQQGSGSRVFEMNYKGSDGIQIELSDLTSAEGASFVARTDISACYPSIYTHSIPWAIHGRHVAKQSYSFAQYGNLLDKATQCVRDGQTNGLLVGPHTSNLLSEIVLCDVDKQLIDMEFTTYARHIDDYIFYARNYDQAAAFIRALASLLRRHDLILNDSKTSIVPIETHLNEDWVSQLRQFHFLGRGSGVSRHTIRDYLDLSARLANKHGINSPLKYAIKSVPKNLNDWPRRFFVQTAVNLALQHPYLARELGPFVFDKHAFEGIRDLIKRFCEKLLAIGVESVQPDAIAHALHYSLTNRIQLSAVIDHQEEILKIDDCLSNVLLFEYAKQFKLDRICGTIRKLASDLSGAKRRDQDRNWLLLYQVWDENELRRFGQPFLATLKKNNFTFIKPPTSDTRSN